MSGINGFLGFPFVRLDAAKRWALWREGLLSDLASNDIFVVVFNNLVAGGADVGQGCGLTGTDATFICNGAVPDHRSMAARTPRGWGVYPQGRKRLAAQRASGNRHPQTLRILWHDCVTPHPY